MTKSETEQFDGQAGGGADRRAASRLDLPALQPSDFDPAMGTLLLQRFMSLLVERQQSAPGALLVIDLDNPSTAIGRESGDAVAEFQSLLAQAIRQAVRADDWIAHVADCRFALLLHGADQALADIIADRIRESVADTMFLTSEGIAQLAVAVGGIAFTPARPVPAGLFEAANVNLAEARSAQSGTCVR